MPRPGSGYNSEEEGPRVRGGDRRLGQGGEENFDSGPEADDDGSGGSEAPPWEAGGGAEEEGAGEEMETAAQRYRRLNAATEAPELPPAPRRPRDPGNNSPLAIPGTFVRPGEAGSAPFRTAQFRQNRIASGLEQAPGLEGRFGPGVSTSGGSSMASMPFGAAEIGGGRRMDDEQMRQLIAQGIFSGG